MFDRQSGLPFQSAEDVKFRGYPEAFKEQVKRYGLLGEDLNTLAMRQHFIPTSDTQIHHIIPGRILDKLFAGVTEESERTQLARLLNSGNRLKNLYIMEKIAHEGVKGAFDGVHTRLKNKGLQVQTNAKNQRLHPIVQEIEALTEGDSYGYRYNLAKQIKDELVPLIKQELDDTLNDYNKYNNC